MTTDAGKKALQAVALAFWLACGALCCGAATAADTRAEKDVLRMLEAYRDSIIHADDISRAQAVWLADPGVSFIHPRGHERGWEQIKNNFYRRIMSETFSRRDLRLVGAPAIRVCGDAALVEFDWRFTATRRKDGALRQSSGRESQVYVRTPKGWKLVHAHYSGPAAPQAPASGKQSTPGSDRALP